MTHILVIWTFVGFIYSPSSYERQEKYDWRSIGEFKTKKACETGGKKLARKFECLPTN